VLFVSLTEQCRSASAQMPWRLFWQTEHRARTRDVTDSPRRSETERPAARGFVRREDPSVSTHRYHAMPARSAKTNANACGTRAQNGQR
jgi:hypothetical protein